MKVLQSKLTKFLVLIIFSLFATLLLQQWVGGEAIYSDENQAARLKVHEAILHNEPVPGTQLHIRVFTVYLAHAINILMHISVLDAYKVIDTISLFITFVLLYVYLKKWFNDSYCLIGMFYFFYACVSTYFLYYFHPWDRLSLLSWLIMLFLLRADRILLFALVLAISVTIKYDVISLPALYWFYKISLNNWKKTTLVTLGLFAICFGVFEILTTMTSTRSNFLVSETGIKPNFIQIFFEYTKINYWSFIRHIPGYLPLLVFTFPVLLSLITLAAKERFVASCTLFGIILFPCFFFTANFSEVRAEMPILILLLPSALVTLRSMLETNPVYPQILGLEN